MMPKIGLGANSLIQEKNLTHSGSGGIDTTRSKILSKTTSGPFTTTQDAYKGFL